MKVINNFRICSECGKAYDEAGWKYQWDIKVKQKKLGVNGYIGEVI